MKTLRIKQKRELKAAGKGAPLPTPLSSTAPWLHPHNLQAEKRQSMRVNICWGQTQSTHTVQGRKGTKREKRQKITRLKGERKTTATTTTVKKANSQKKKMNDRHTGTTTDMGHCCCLLLPHTHRHTQLSQRIRLWWWASCTSKAKNRPNQAEKGTKKYQKKKEQTLNKQESYSWECSTGIYPVRSWTKQFLTYLWTYCAFYFVLHTLQREIQ